MARFGTYLMAALLTLTVAFAIAPCTAFANEKTSLPLVMVVVGFDGGDDPEASVPYSDDYDWSEALFGAEESPAAYFLDMSEGVFTFTPARETSEEGAADNTNIADRANDGVVHVTLHRGHGAWGAVNVDPAVTREFATFVIEALTAAGEFVDFAAYDANGDGELSENELAICLCVAGYEGASVTDFRREDIPLTWSHAGYLSIIGNERAVEGLQFNTYIAIAEQYWDEIGPLETAEQEPLGTVYHELGHVLGLPDLYAVKYTEGPWEDYKVGAISLMDSGGWQYADDGNGWRNIPTALDAWSRYVLGWTTPAIAVRSGDYVVSSQLSDSGYSQVIVPTNDPDEYFLIENRPIEGQDIGLTDDYYGPVGVIVWHVDNNIYERYYDVNQVNDANHHPAVMPENQQGETAFELLLYNDGDDDPDACIDAGISVSFDPEAGRDASVHIEFDDATGPANAFHLLHDAARDSLGPERELLPTICRLLEGCI